MMKHAFVAALVIVLTGCATNFPDNPTPDELNEMRAIMNECLDGIIPLENSWRWLRSAKARNRPLCGPGATPT